VRDEDDTARDEEHGARNRGGGACLEAVEHSMRDSTRCLCHSTFGGLVPQARTRTLSWARPYGVPGASLVSWRGLPSGVARR
jgi:hypothetical protein